MNYSLFIVTLLMGFFSLAAGFYAINRGKNLAEGEKVGGLGTYYDRTGFIARGIIGVALGIFLLILSIASTFS
jgi:hypothetical protein